MRANELLGKKGGKEKNGGKRDDEARRLLAEVDPHTLQMDPIKPGHWA